MSLAGLRLEAFGVVCELSCQHDEVLVPLAEELCLQGWHTRFIEEAPSDRMIDWADGLYRFLVAGEVVYSTPQEMQMALVVAGNLQQKVAQDSDFLFLHSGVVGTPAGVVLLPGKSFAGKSTLVHSLVEAGAIYYSDEFAIVEASTLLVHAFPRKLVLRQTDLSGQKIGGAGGYLPPQRVAAVFTLQFSEQGWAVETCSPANSVLNLFGNLVAARRFGARALSCLAALVPPRNFQGTRGQASQAARSILALMGEN